MANTQLTLQVITNDLLRCLTPALQPLGDIVYMDVNGACARLGDTVIIREQPAWNPLRWDDPPSFVTETRHQVVLNQQANVMFPVDAALLFALSIHEFERDFIYSAIFLLEQKIQSLWPPGATLVTAAMQVPVGLGSGVDAAVAADPISGLSIRGLSQYDAVNGVHQFRFDMLFGFHNVVYVPSAVEVEMLALLAEARIHLVKRLEHIRRAA